MIITKNLLSEQLYTTFKVIKVNWEPDCESKWLLQFEDQEPIEFHEIPDTREEDELLVGKTVRVQVDLSMYRRNEITLITDPAKQRKSIEKRYYEELSYLNVVPYNFIFNGIYMDDVVEEGEEGMSSCVQSLYPLYLNDSLSEYPYNFKKGDWVSIEPAVRRILLDRKYLPID